MRASSLSPKKPCFTVSMSSSSVSCRNSHSPISSMLLISVGVRSICLFCLMCRLVPFVIQRMAMVIVISRTTISVIIRMALADSRLKMMCQNVFCFLFSMLKCFVNQCRDITAVQVVSEMNGNILLGKSQLLK